MQFQILFFNLVIMAYKTLITQELLKNILATNKMFISVLHNKKFTELPLTIK